MTISPIYELIKAEIDRAGNAFIKQKIEPWIFFNVKGVKIEKSDGTQINIPRFQFSGSARLVFWDGFVDEELTALALSLFEDARTKAIEHGVPIESSILACNDCLSGLVLKVFERMADIDQRLRGKGYPNSVSKENVGKRASNLCRVIEKFAEAHIASADVKLNQPLARCLEDFAIHIKAEMRMTFWQFDKTKKKNKWVSQPEQHGKDLLRTHLNGRFGDSFYTLEEISAGAGMIDLYIITPNGEKAIVELKMCGHGYTKKWALGGIEQLFHYMENKRTTTGYLIVFDSRVRDFSIGFPPTKSANEMLVTTILIDLRPYVKREDAPDNV